MGEEFQVNTYTTGGQWVARRCHGLARRLRRGVVGQAAGFLLRHLRAVLRCERYSARRGVPHQRRTTAPGGRIHSSRVDSDASGNFVVTWMSVAAERTGECLRDGLSPTEHHGAVLSSSTTPRRWTQCARTWPRAPDGAFTIAWDTRRTSGRMLALPDSSPEASMRRESPTQASFAINSEHDAGATDALRRPRRARRPCRSPGNASNSSRPAWTAPK